MNFPFHVCEVIGALEFVYIRRVWP